MNIKSLFANRHKFESVLTYICLTLVTIISLAITTLTKTDTTSEFWSLVIARFPDELPECSIPQIVYIFYGPVGHVLWFLIFIVNYFIFAAGKVYLATIALLTVSGYTSVMIYFQIFQSLICENQKLILIRFIIEYSIVSLWLAKIWKNHYCLITNVQPQGVVKGFLYTIPKINIKVLCKGSKQSQETSIGSILRNEKYSSWYVDVENLDKNGGISPNYLKNNSEAKFIYLVLKTKIVADNDFTRNSILQKCKDYEELYKEGFESTLAVLDQPEKYSVKFLNISPYPYRSKFTSLSISLQSSFFYWVVAVLPLACLNGVLFRAWIFSKTAYHDKIEVNQMFAISERLKENVALPKRDHTKGFQMKKLNREETVRTSVYTGEVLPQVSCRYNPSMSAIEEELRASRSSIQSGF